ncbi:DUF4256 domain-containing protein [Breznakiella homolactica]|uniref:DUF4256 domain-containing protein n=2 Tax=Breznakiella homolactica TaxID=2798577 RepID=A0A7T8BDP4_9SPIR|nr:DUF4256 domain-containing protein [Breznakiella homolactica]
MAQEILSKELRQKTLEILRDRFTENQGRHRGLKWEAIRKRLDKEPEKLWSLNEMEKTGGEPDVIGRDKTTGEYLFADCSAETPKGRMNLCYDREALDSRKTTRPKGSAAEKAAAMGVEILSEEQYRYLQKLGEFDSKTSSWILTPADVRSLGGALFADRRYGRIFVYHNSAPSYYSSRGFRGILRI